MLTATLWGQAERKIVTTFNGVAILKFKNRRFGEGFLGSIQNLFPFQEQDHPFSLVDFPDAQEVMLGNS